MIKFGPDGRVLMVMGRKPEAVTVRLPPARGAGARASPGGAADAEPRRLPEPAARVTSSTGRATSPGTPRATSSSPTAMAPTRASPSSTRTAGSSCRGDREGSEPGQFNTPHALAIDAQGNVYVADQGNKRIQVFDNAGTFKSQIANIGVPTALCITRGAHQYLYSAHTGDPYGMDDAAIYKLELDGRIVGNFGKAGKLAERTRLVNALDCRTENELYVGELSNWRVQKLILKPSAAGSR